MAKDLSFHIPKLHRIRLRDHKFDQPPRGKVCPKLEWMRPEKPESLKLIWLQDCWGDSGSGDILRDKRRQHPRQIGKERNAGRKVWSRFFYYYLQESNWMTEFSISCRLLNRLKLGYCCNYQLYK